MKIETVEPTFLEYLLERIGKTYKTASKFLAFLGWTKPPYRLEYEGYGVTEVYFVPKDTEPFVISQDGPKDARVMLTAYKEIPHWIRLIIEEFEGKFRGHNITVVLGNNA